MASTPTTTAPRKPRSGRRRGFTLVELMIAASLSTIILVGVLSTALMITRSGYLLVNYIDMEKQARHALETFAVDARITESVQWTRAADTAPLTAITLIQPSGGATITYTYNPAAQTLVRSTPSGSPTTLITGIQSFSFTAYKYKNASGPEPIASTTNLTQMANETKMVQLSLSALRTRSVLADATNTVVSARFVLRNRIIAN
jgi:prepilin-type N-terminal cleavage/methylation domain-containing protein